MWLLNVHIGAVAFNFLWLRLEEHHLFDASLSEKTKSPEEKQWSHQRSFPDPLSSSLIHPGLQLLCTVFSVWEKPKVRLDKGWDVLHNLVSLPTEKGPPPAAEGQPAPPWITIARQKRRGTPNQPPNQEDKPGVRTLKSEIGKQAKAPERTQVLRANAFCLYR